MTEPTASRATMELVDSPGSSPRARADLGDRVAACMLDGLVGFGLFAVAAIVFGEARSGAVTQPDGGHLDVGVQLEVGQMPQLVVAISWFGYVIVCESILGGTIGKRFMGLRVIRVRGGPVGWAALVRHLPHVIPCCIFIFVGPLVLLSPVIFLSGVLIARMSPNRQRLGDRLAGTIVVFEDPDLPNATNDKLT